MKTSLLPAAAARAFAIVLTVSALSACAPVILKAPAAGVQVPISGIDVEMFKTGIEPPADGALAQSAAPTGYTFHPEEHLIALLPGKLAAAGIPARAKLVYTLAGDPKPAPDQVFPPTSATPHALLVLSKLKSETICTAAVCGTSNYYLASLEDGTTHVQQWAGQFMLGSNDHSPDTDKNYQFFMGQVVQELQKVVVVR